MGDPSEAPAKAHIGDQYDVPDFEPHSSVTTLKERIRHHYELASDYYYSLWGQHIHHAYFLSPSDTKETGQTNLINLLLEISALKPATSVLDVGCGIGGTTRHLARDHGCTVTGITISGHQVQIAKRLTREESSSSDDNGGFTPIGTQGGRVRYQELDAEKMDAHFSADTFDAVWISEALSHFPDKPLFFRNAARVLKGNGKLVIADWFKDEDLNQEAMENDIKPIEDGMLLPPLCTQSDYISLAEKAGLKVLHPPKDISKDVAKTW
ncbi:hypothetical protein LTR10_014320 [Elasticomyces elasticus]|uniref:Methyltransferase type 11 domain-containing protein n=1 Tax=Exophiala sideris TaxID=1016849 RepID=A0ABR0JID4_9EURO|nr:hypothetical protein LTR10_014320 [Elasticomyces elasticus]KAK5034362.1 hypothetical protein LTS07_003283 [Exophiala sideris]KAK5042659.1 hypothetical protein LTR13_001507 [Exophiala sideris]KAK5065741.1 hypothetical protein LTR69_003291 [Exophiala sideris]KAK5185799.1 hypothetical protein LTR44_001848 [Eurotiomycetes sp. CCFEE 6388]